MKIHTCLFGVMTLILSEPQRRMLAALPEHDSEQRAMLFWKSKSHNSGYRVAENLVKAGLVTMIFGSGTDEPRFKLTDAGREKRKNLD